jgi:hypothetical protein
VSCLLLRFSLFSDKFLHVGRNHVLDLTISHSLGTYT